MFHLKNIHARAPLLSSLPSPSSRENFRSLLSRSRPWSDLTETPITRSLRLLVALTLRNLVHFTPELVSGTARAETLFAMIAMSGLEAGKVLTDVLAMLSGVTEDETVFMTHLPPFR